MGDALREKQPEPGALMDASRDDVLAYMTFPREPPPGPAGTVSAGDRINRLLAIDERRLPAPIRSSASTESKRRADVIGIFPDDHAIVRLVGAPMLETNDEWAVARRYLSLATLARITGNPTIRLLAVAA